MSFLRLILSMTLFAVFYGSAFAQTRVAPSAPYEFQMGGNLSGLSSNAVDLFTGKVSFSIPIAQSNGKGNSGINFGINYSSSTTSDDESKRDNAIAPTGVLGIGWSFQTARILNDYKGTATTEDDEYYLNLDGSSKKLLLTNKSNNVYSFITEEATPFLITYWSDPMTERWEVLTDDRTTFTFGGVTGLKPDGYNKAGKSNSIEWLVSTGDKIIPTNTVFDGTTRIQTQQAISWSLESVTDQFGNKTSYSYESLEVPVGQLTGCFYTRFQNLIGIEDNRGNKLEIIYTDKTTDELILRHPWTSGNPAYFQDKSNPRFITQFLLKNQAAVIVKTVDLTYNFLGSGEKKKRFLTRIIESNPFGEKAPDLVFKYFENPAEFAYGKIFKVVSPLGQEVLFSYQNLNLPNTDLDTPIIGSYNPISVIQTGQGQLTVSHNVYTPSDGGYVMNGDMTLDYRIFSNGKWSQAFRETVTGLQKFNHIYYGEGVYNYDIISGKDYLAVIFNKNRFLKQKRVVFFTKSITDGEWKKQEFADNDLILGTQAEETIIQNISSPWDCYNNSLKICNGNDWLSLICENSGRTAIFNLKNGEWTKFRAENSSLFSYQYGKSNSYIQNYEDVLTTPNGFALYETNENALDKIIYFFKSKTGEWSQKVENASHNINVGNINNITSGPNCSVYGFPELSNIFIYIYADKNNDIKQENISVSIPVSKFIFREDKIIASGTFTLAGITKNVYQIFKSNGASWASIYSTQLTESGQDQIDFQPGEDLNIILKDGNNYFHKYSYNYNTSAWDDQNSNITSASPNFISGNGYVLAGNKIYRTDKTIPWPEIGTVSGTPFPSAISSNWAYSYFQNSGLPSIKWTQFVNKYPLVSTANYFAYNLPDQTNSNKRSKIVFTSRDGFSEQDVDGNFFLEKDNPYITGDQFLNSNQMFKQVGNSASGSMGAVAVLSVTLNDGIKLVSTLYEFDLSGRYFDHETMTPVYNKVKVSPATGGYKNYYFSIGDGCPGFEGESTIKTVENFTTPTPYSICQNNWEPLKGSLYKTETYAQDGTKLQSTRNYYKVISFVSSGVKTFSTFLSTRKNNEGSAEIVENYNYELGVLPVNKFVWRLKSSSMTNSDGIEYKTEYTYSFPTYTDALDANFINFPVQVTTKTGTKVTGSQVSTLKKVGNAFYPFRSYQYIGSEDGTPSFSTWDTTTEPDITLWKKQSEVVALSPSGNVLEMLNAEGKTTSFQHTSGDEYLIATFQNASRLQTGQPLTVGRDASFLGFESGSTSSQVEANDYWIINSAGTNDLALGGHTGKYAVKIAKKTTARVFGPTRDFLPSNQSGKFMVSCWVKTEPGYVNGTAALLLQTKKNNDDNTVFPAAGMTVSSIDATAGKWKYISAVLDLNAIRGSVTEPLRLRTYVYNESTVSTVWVDDIRFTPYHSVSTVSVQDTLLHFPIAVMGNNQETAYTYYDEGYNFFSGTDGNGLIRSYTTNYNTRKGNGGDVYVATDPNSTLSVSVQNGGAFYNFNYENTDWTLTNAVRKQGKIYHDSQTLNGEMVYTPSTFSNSGIRLSLKYGSQSKNFKLAVGNYHVTSSETAWTLVYAGSGATLKTAPRTGEGKEWTLFTIGKRLLFFADGKLTLDYTDPATISGTLKFVFVAGTTGFVDNVLIMKSPVLGMQYADASGKLIQSQVMNGDNIVVSGPVYDAANRPAISPKPALYTNQGFGFRSDYITSFNWTTGAIAGTVISSNPNDGGFPYSRAIFDQSPLSRLIKSGQPGADFHAGTVTRPLSYYQDQAVVGQMAGDDEKKFLVSSAFKPEDNLYYYSKTDFTGKKIADRVGPLTEGNKTLLVISQPGPETDCKSIMIHKEQTISWSVTFGTTGAADENDSFSGVFRIGTTPNGSDVYTKTRSNTTGGGVFSGVIAAIPGKEYFFSYDVSAHNLVRKITVTATVNYLNSEFKTTTYQYNAKGQVEKVFTPNYYAPPTAGVPAESYIESFSYDNQGRLIASTSKEKGESQLAYDRMGRLRFMMQASGKASSSGNPDKIKYFKYDEMNRVIEEGFVDDQVWTVMIAQADNSAIPVNASKWRVKSYYDQEWTGTSWVTKKRGLLYRKLINTNDDAASEVDEQYVYDDLDRLISKKELVTRYHATTVYITQYTYNILNQVTRITYPSGLQVDYAYDEFGRLKTVGTPADPDYYSLYTYDQLSGRLQQETIATAGVNTPITYTYNSPGWLSAITGAYFAENLSYKTGRYGDNLGYSDGKIASVSYAYPSTSMSGIPGDHTIKYGYDKLGQLTTADYVTSNAFLNQADLGVGVGLQATYDPNQNILQSTKASDPLIFAFEPGTSRVSSMLNATIQSTYSFSYDPSGLVKTRTYNDGEGGLPETDDYTFDYYTNLLKGAVKKSGAVTLSTVAISYEGSGMRVLKEVTTGSTTKYRLYLNSAEGTPLEIREKTGATGTETVKQYIYGLNGLIALKQGTVEYFILKDHLGSTKVVLNAATGVTSRMVGLYEYSPFGEVVFSKIVGSVVCDFTYTGQEWDADLGLMNYKARMYDPKTQRFLSPDPLNQYPSPYAYVGNNPISLVDPTGMGGIPNDGVINNDILLNFYYNFNDNWENYWAPSNGSYGARARGENNTPYGISKGQQQAHDRQTRDWWGAVSVPEYTIQDVNVIQMKWNIPTTGVEPLPVAALPTNLIPPDHPPINSPQNPRPNQPGNLRAAGIMGGSGSGVGGNSSPFSGTVEWRFPWFVTLSIGILEGGVLTSGDINESGVINTTIGNNFELSGSLRVFETKDFNLSLGSNGYHMEISAGSFTYYAESNYKSFEQGMTGTVGSTSFGFYSSYTPNWVNLGLSVAFAATGAYTVRVLPYATKVVLDWAKQK